MRGDLSANGLWTIFDELAGDDANGALHLESPHGQAKVFFREGDVYYASSPAPRAQLGARLIGAGFIDDEDLDRALEAQQQGPERTKLGAILVDQGMVRRDVIRVFVQEQILDAVFDLARWDEGEYEFFGGDAVAEDLPVQIPTGPLLMEVRRRLAEWDDIREVIPSLEAVPDFVRGGSTAQAALEPDEFTLLTSVDGRRSVRELAHDLGYSQFDAARLIYGLSLLGVIAVPNGEAPATADERPAEGPEDIDIGRALEEALFGGGYEELEEEHPAQPAPRGDDPGIEVREPAARRPDETVAPEPGTEVPEPEAEVPEPEPEPEPEVPEPEVARGSDDLEPEVWSASIDIDDAAGTHGDAPAVEPEGDLGAAPEVEPPEVEPEGRPEVEPDEAAEDAQDELLALMDELQSASDQVEEGVDEPPAAEARDAGTPAGEPPAAEPPAEPRSPVPDEPGPEVAEPSAPRQEPAAPSDPGAGPAEERAERGDVSELLRELSRLADDGPEPVAPSPEDRTEPDGPSRDEPAPPSHEDEPEQAPQEADDRDDERDDKDDDKRSTFRRLFGSR